MKINIITVLVMVSFLITTFTVPYTNHFKTLNNSIQGDSMVGDSQIDLSEFRTAITKGTLKRSQGNSSISLELKDGITEKPINNGHLVLYGGNPFCFYSEDIGTDGTYSASLNPGHYFLSVEVMEDQYLSKDELHTFTSEHPGAWIRTERIGDTYRVSTHYFPYSNEFNILSKQHLDLEIILELRLKDISVLQGFIRDGESNKPIPYIPVRTTTLTSDYIIFNETYSDETGHYIISVPKGETHIISGEKGSAFYGGGYSLEQLNSSNFNYFPSKDMQQIETPGNININLQNDKISENDMGILEIELLNQHPDDMEEICIFIFDTCRGIFYLKEIKNKEMVKNKIYLNSALPKGNYTVFGVGYQNGSYGKPTEISRFELIKNQTHFAELKISGEIVQDMGHVALTFTKGGGFQINNSINIERNPIIFRSILESFLGDGNFHVSVSEKKRIEKYLTAIGISMIKPLIQSGMEYHYLYTQSNTAEFHESFKGDIDNQEIILENTFISLPNYDPLDLIDKQFSFDFKTIIPLSLTLEIELPNEFTYELIDQNNEKNITIMTSSLWNKGLSADFREKFEYFGIKNLEDNENDRGRLIFQKYVMPEKGFMDGETIIINITGDDDNEGWKTESNDDYKIYFLSVGIIILLAGIILAPKLFSKKK